ncbi:hypothetical protein Trydic_g228 [Trypoxylus dichotomus]
MGRQIIVCSSKIFLTKKKGAMNSLYVNFNWGVRNIGSNPLIRYFVSKVKRRLNSCLFHSQKTIMYHVYYRVY